MSLKMTASEVRAFLDREFPQVGDEFAVDALEEMGARTRLHVGEAHLRPGGTVSGPAIFALADVSFYVALLGMIGPRALAVTTNCSLDFMRRPAAGADLLAECRLLKLGRVLAVGDVLITSEEQAAPAARASLTYSIPPEAAA